MLWTTTRILYASELTHGDLSRTILSIRLNPSVLIRIWYPLYHLKAYRVWRARCILFSCPSFFITAFVVNVSARGNSWHKSRIEHPRLTKHLPPGRRTSPGSAVRGLNSPFLHILSTEMIEQELRACRNHTGSPSRYSPLCFSRKRGPRFEGPYHLTARRTWKLSIESRVPNYIKNPLPRGEKLPWTRFSNPTCSTNLSPWKSNFPPQDYALCWTLQCLPTGFWSSSLILSIPQKSRYQLSHLFKYPPKSPKKITACFNPSLLV